MTDKKLTDNGIKRLWSVAKLHMTKIVQSARFILMTEK